MDDVKSDYKSVTCVYGRMLEWRKAFPKQVVWGKLGGGGERREERDRETERQRDRETERESMCHCAYGRMAEWRKATCIKRVMAGKEGGGGERSETLLCARV